MYGAARTSKPAISKSFIATIFWALLSLGMMAGGWTYCSRKLESTTLKCDMRGCKLAELTDGVVKVLTIPRMNMIRGELVRVKNGAIVDPSKMRRSAQRKLGHTYAVVYTEPDSEDDDDESYDSFEDDDDSYDSYDDDQDSSEDDDEDDDRARGAGKPGQRANAPPAKKPTVNSAKSSKTMPKPPSEEEKKAAADRREAARKAAFEKKAADRARYAEERRSMGKEPVREPDEQRPSRPVRREAAQRPMDDDEYDREDRFPGDAGTMQEKNRDEIARMEAAQGMAGRDHQERSQKAYEEASRKHQNKHRADQQTRQIGNNLHDRKKVSPDDPDSRQPPPK